MRRLMTGYAVTFNKKHKRAGHLFQNRYKSVVCEEDAYLLELIRYFHLNPLRAGLVKDLQELDTYPWSGHSAILGHCKNPLVPEVRDRRSEVSNPKAPIIPSAKGGLFFQFRPETEKDNKHPENPVNPVKDKSLAEKTIEDILLHFGETKSSAIKRYREFVEKGIKQGAREDLRGGGLIRSAGGDVSGLLGRKGEEREKGDARILGSGDFACPVKCVAYFSGVSETLQQAEVKFEKKYLPKRPIEELIEIVAGKLGLKPELICSGNRQRQYSEARSLVAWLAVEEIGHPAAEVARTLGISRVGVLLSLEKAKEIRPKYGFELTPPNLTD